MKKPFPFEKGAKKGAEKGAEKDDAKMKKGKAPVFIKGKAPVFGKGGMVKDKKGY
jgi:hypothetical protein